MSLRLATFQFHKLRATEVNYCAWMWSTVLYRGDYFRKTIWRGTYL